MNIDKGAKGFNEKALAKLPCMVSIHPLVNPHPGHSTPIKSFMGHLQRDIPFLVKINVMIPTEIKTRNNLQNFL